MRGASALEDILKNRPGDITVFVIWEPVLRSDLVGPAWFTLSRISDPRVRQYWDPRRLLSKRIVEEARAGRLPAVTESIEKDAIIWDVVAFYEPGVVWEHGFPNPDYQGYPVVDAAPELSRRLAAGP